MYLVLNFRKIKNYIRSNFQAHPFHLVSPSPWPLYTSISLFSLTAAMVSTTHGFNNAIIVLYIAFITLILSMSFWWRDVISEATYLGNHTLAVQRGLNMGVNLFIVSEALFFLGIFWCHFHCCLSPTIEVGGQWPPIGIDSINPYELPLLNTVLLLSSGVALTYAHHSLIRSVRKGALIGVIYTIILAIIFTEAQAIEYTASTFTITDGAFGSTFYFATGFHGLHVMIGTAFIIVGFIRLLSSHLTPHHHVGFEGSILYWHFVDVVWIFLYISVYCWAY